MTDEPSPRSVIKDFLVAGLALALGLLFWHSLVGDPLDELALIQRGQVAKCVLHESFEDEVENERGDVAVVDVGVYAFTTPEGGTYYASTRAPSGELLPQGQVEYLPDTPSTNRIRGDGCATVGEWLWRKVGMGGLLLAMCVGPGVSLARGGIRDLLRLRARAKT